MNYHSPFWAIGALGLWVVVLSLPLILYFVIAAFQLRHPKGGPDLDHSLDTRSPTQDENEQKKVG